MKRRTFVKKSVAASILTPLALTGLINATGATETGGGGTTGTGGTENTDDTTEPLTTLWFSTLDSTDEITNLPPDPPCRNSNYSKEMCCFDVGIAGIPTTYYYKCMLGGLIVMGYCDETGKESQKAYEKCKP
jgi:hypothetical protein